jgi:integrase
MSRLKHHFNNLKQNLCNFGYTLSYLEPNLNDLDLFYDETFPELETVTFESATSWIYSKKMRSIKALRDRISSVKYLSEYLNSLGIEAYIPDIKVRRSFHKRPQMMNDEQLQCFFAAADGLKLSLASPNRELVAPVLFRLIYSCGLRNSEACLIRMEDIDLQCGIIRIIHSKGDKDRVVYMCEQMTDLCRRFDKAYTMKLPGRKYFFQLSAERLHPTKHNVDDWFDLLLGIAHIDKEFCDKPTVHGLRHLFAVKSMKACLSQGENFENWIKYLSKYMGHESIKETMYYLHMVETLIPEYRKAIDGITKGMGVVNEEF